MGDPGVEDGDGLNKATHSHRQIKKKALASASENNTENVNGADQHANYKHSVGGSVSEARNPLETKQANDNHSVGVGSSTVVEARNAAADIISETGSQANAAAETALEHGNQDNVADTTSEIEQAVDENHSVAVRNAVDVAIIENGIQGNAAVIALEPEIQGNEVGIALESEEPSGSIMTEVLKSIVYGGLNEVITSLGIVTSTAATQATTGKVVALSFSCVIVGAFIIGYNIAQLYMNNQQRRLQEREAEEEEVHRYEELLGDKKNYCLHSTVAILSFLFFGLVPPLVYGFTFRKPEDKALKIQAVTGVSFFCIALLAMVKAHMQRPENCAAYIVSIGNHIFDGLGASVATTFAGGLIEKYIEQFGWFEPNETPKLLLFGMGFGNLTWGSS